MPNFISKCNKTKTKPWKSSITKINTSKNWNKNALPRTLVFEVWRTKNTGSEVWRTHSTQQLKRDLACCRLDPKRCWVNASSIRPKRRELVKRRRLASWSKAWSRPHPQSWLETKSTSSSALTHKHHLTHNHLNPSTHHQHHQQQLPPTILFPFCPPTLLHSHSPPTPSASTSTTPTPTPAPKPGSAAATYKARGFYSNAAPKTPKERFHFSS